MHMFIKQAKAGTQDLSGFGGFFYCVFLLVLAPRIDSLGRRGWAMSIVLWISCL